MLQTIETTKKGEYVIIKLNRGKVNAINQLMVDELRKTFENLKNNPTVRGVIVTGISKYFSAGLDVIELFKYDKIQIATFFKTFGYLYIEMARFPKPLIAAITGHAPAGGTVITITCDYKVMAQDTKYSIGLNEILVNVPLSEDLIRGYSFWLGNGVANQSILQGKLFCPEDAKKNGLIDETCPLDLVLPNAEKKMKQFLEADTDIFNSAKYFSRKSWIDNLGTSEVEALQSALKIWWQPSVRSRLEMFVYLLTKK